MTEVEAAGGITDSMDMHLGPRAGGRPLFRGGLWPLGACLAHL